MVKKRKHIIWLYAESAYTPWKEWIDGRTVAALVHAAPREYECSIVHYCEPCSAIADQICGADLVFNLCYGFLTKTQAQIAGWLEEMSVTHTAPSRKSQEVAQDKRSLPSVCEIAGVSTPDIIEESDIEDVPDLLIAKPRFGGCHKHLKIGRGAELAGLRQQHGDIKFVYQRYLSGREFSVTIVPNDECTAWISLPPLEVIPTPFREIYVAGGAFGRTTTEFHPRVEPAISESLQSVALAVHKAFGLGAYSRIDLRLTADGGIYVLDVNSMPNLHLESSFLPRCCQAHGISLTELVRRVIEFKGIPLDEERGQHHHRH